MTDKELRKLSRKDLLNLLLVQSKESLARQEQISALGASLAEREKTVEHLKARLDEKDEELDRLKKLLDEREEALRTLRCEQTRLGNLPAFAHNGRAYTVDEATAIFREVLCKLSESKESDAPQQETP